MQCNGLIFPSSTRHPSNIASPFFYKTEQSPKYQLGIGSMLVANGLSISRARFKVAEKTDTLSPAFLTVLELILIFVIRFIFIQKNKVKERQREAARLAAEADGDVKGGTVPANDTAFSDLTDKQNIK